MSTARATPGLTVQVQAVLVTVQVLFASLAIAGRFVLGTLPAPALIVCRTSGAALLLALLHWRRGGRWITDRRDLLELAGLGLLGIALNQSLFVIGLSHTTAINATILATLVPVLTVVGAIVLGRERPSARKLGGVALAFVGTVWLIGPDRISTEPEVALGNLLIVIGMTAYTAYFLFAGRMLAKYDAVTVTTHVMLAAALMTLPLGLGPLVQLNASAVPAPVWGWTLWIILGPTLLTYLLNIWALARVSSNVVAIYIYLQPILTMAVAPLLLSGERLTPRTLAAATLIFSGVLLVLRAERGPVRPSPDRLRTVTDPASTTETAGQRGA